MRSLIKKSLLLFLFLGSSTQANDSEFETPPETPAYWDFGIGFGAIHFEQYPAAGQFSNLALPVPTFQYRGKILRADDRDGAHIYLFKGSSFILELSGEGNPALDSSNNQARTGMEDLPWLIALGPQLVSRSIESFEFGLGIYQAITTDFQMARVAGNIFEGRATYEWRFPFEARGPFSEGGYSLGKLTLSLKGGSKEFHSLYFEVPVDKATTERPAYEARDGFLSHNLSYYQTFKSGRVSLYVGVALNSYDQSANRLSPLHKSDTNISALVGFNYILRESAKPAVPEDETSGLINSLGKNRNLRNSL